MCIRDRLNNGVSIINRFVEKYGQIYISDKAKHIGDLVFFSNTYDRNKDGRNNDVFTHIGIIESINHKTGQMTFLHNLGKKAQRSFLNLRQKYSHKASQNSFLRRKRKNDPSGTTYLASELFHHFGSTENTF